MSAVCYASHVQPLVRSQTSATMSFEGGRVEVVSTQLDVEPAAAKALAHCLSDEERLKASRFAFERDRCRFVVGRARLRQLLASRLGIKPGEVEFTYGARGKPALSPRLPDTNLRFNVSHSESVAVYAFSDGRDVGIDVEVLHELPDGDDVAARFFSAQENEAYLALPRHDKAVGFLNCWTRKEAFIKALGDGLHYPLDHFDVSLAPGEQAKILRVGHLSGDDCGWTVHELPLGPRLIGAVVVQKQATNQVAGSNQ